MSKRNKDLDELKKLAGTIKSRYETYQTSYLEAKGFKKRATQSVDFYEGRQWGTPTKNTATLPRPVFPITSLVVNSQISNILGSPFKLNYQAPNEHFGADVFTQFAQYQMAEARFDTCLEKSVCDSEVKCSGIIYEYWDEFARGKNGKYRGALRYAVLDPLEIAFSDPSTEEIQDQEWIIYPKRVSIKEARKMCTTLSKEEMAKYILPDTLESDYDETVELDDTKRITIYTMFYRVNGEVVFVKSTNGIVIVDETYLNPYITKREIENKENKEVLKEEEIKENEQFAKEDGSHADTADNELEKRDYKDRNYMFSLYPFAILNTVPMNKSILGMGTAYNIIPNNKIINFIYALNVMNIQNLAWGKVLVKENALKGQRITNQPGQVLVDHSPGGNWGITNMPGQQTLSNGATEQAKSIIELTRGLNNADEIMTGDMLTKNLSGTAIAQIEAMRTKNVDRKQRRVWRFIEELGRIAYQFYVAYYNREDFIYSFNDEDFSIMNEQNPGMYPTKDMSLEFNGEDFLDYNFEVSCEVGAGSQFSEISQMESLNQMLAGQYIDFETYVDLYPDNQMPYKATLKSKIQAQKTSELAQWQQAYAELQATIEANQQELSYQTEKANKMESYAKNLKSTFKEMADSKNNEISSMRDYMATLPGTSRQTNSSGNDDKNVS